MARGIFRISKRLRRQKRSFKSTANVKWNCLKAILITQSPSIAIVLNISPLRCSPIFSIETYEIYADVRIQLLVCLHPFIRNTIGCMEFGGTLLNKRHNRTNEGGTIRKTTDVFQLATAVLYQNPIQNFALAPNNLTDAPALAIDFMKQVPTTWDETVFLDCHRRGIHEWERIALFKTFTCRSRLLDINRTI